MLRSLFITIFVFTSSFSHAQIEWGGKVGLSLNFGTHVRKLGVMAAMWSYNDFAEINTGINANLVGRNLGPEGRMLELVAYVGIQGHWGDSIRRKYYHNEFSNLSSRPYSVGYTFYQFISGKNTSQSTGAIHFNIDAFQFALTNDALGANQIDDKYRTGGFSFSYLVDSTLVTMQNTLWTGKSADAPKIKDDQYPSRDGYRDISKAKYGGISHGIFAIRADFILPYEQVGRAEIGFDSEKIRHLVQNKLMHDGLLPLFVNSENPHYPMLQADSTAFTFKDVQQIRKGRPYLQGGFNQPSFY